jgi:hypothetical protein
LPPVETISPQNGEIEPARRNAGAGSLNAAAAMIVHTQRFSCRRSALGTFARALQDCADQQKVISDTGPATMRCLHVLIRAIGAAPLCMTRAN